MTGVPLYRTEAIVLRASDFGEAHRLVTLLTPGRGKLRAVAKGVKRPTSRLAAALLPFTHARLLLWEGRSLDGISQAEICHSFRPLREDLERLTRACYACELVGEMVPEGPEAAAVFRLLLWTLRRLAAGGQPDLPLRYLELHLLRLAGFAPRLDACAACGGPVAPPAPFVPAAGGCLCPACRPGQSREEPAVWLDRGAAAAARALLGAAPRVAAGLRLPGAALASLGGVTEGYLRFLLQKRLKSQPFLDILSAIPPEEEALSRGRRVGEGHPGED